MDCDGLGKGKSRTRKSVKNELFREETVHRGELSLLVREAECLKHCSALQSLCTSKNTVSTSPSMETLTSLEKTNSTFDLRDGNSIVVCLDKDRPWVQLKGSTRFVTSTSVETEELQLDELRRSVKTLHELLQNTQF